MNRNVFFEHVIDNYMKQHANELTMMPAVDTCNLSAKPASIVDTLHRYAKPFTSNILRPTAPNSSHNVKNILTDELTFAAERRETTPAAYCDVDYYDRKKVSKCLHSNQMRGVNKTMGDKWGQYRVLTAYARARGVKLPYLPYTATFTKNRVDRMRALIKDNSSQRWILKPTNSSHRSGIKIIRTFAELRDAVASSKYPKWILQHYIENPLLVEGKKCHIRVYAVLVRRETQFTVHMYNSGVMYLAKDPHDANTTDPMVCLSGGNISKTMRMYPEVLDKLYPRKFQDVLLPQLQQIVHDTCDAAANYLECYNKNTSCFKLIAYDVLINQQFKCFLAETNVRTIEFAYPPPAFRQMLYTDMLDLYFERATSSRWLPVLSRAVPLRAEDPKNVARVQEGFTNAHNAPSVLPYALLLTLCSAVLVGCIYRRG